MSTKIGFPKIGASFQYGNLSESVRYEEFIYISWYVYLLSIRCDMNFIVNQSGYDHL